MNCRICTMDTLNKWKNKPVCKDCIELARQLIEERPFMNMRQALETTGQMIRRGIDFKIKQLEEQENGKQHSSMGLGETGSNDDTVGRGSESI